ncbi:putative peptidase family protein [Candida albicans]|uniref:Putative peptidase family protein n=1 Tax=Candida albicans TaxID=5476 RepID=A0A8H6F5W5_CANAX|nr:putative peptidase family protein [Candida albicans]
MAGSAIGEVPTIVIKLLFVTYLLLPEDTYPNYAPVDIPSLELAQENSTYAVRNSNSLIYYALDVYAYDVTIPGEGCNGDGTSYKKSDFSSFEDSDSGSDSGASSTASSSHQHTDSNPSATTDANSHCHTHADGEVHC